MNLIKKFFTPDDDGPGGDRPQDPPKIPGTFDPNPPSPPVFNPNPPPEPPITPPNEGE